MCIWGGFPKLVGEPSPRLRFAQGMVSSEMYKSQEGWFFELDGMFSPGHSGSAVINIETGKLVGVVSQSAGNLVKQFENAIHIFKAIDAIQSRWQLFEETRESMDRIWNSVSESIQELQRQIDELYNSLGSFGSSSIRTGTMTDPFLWYRSYLSTHINGKLSNDVVEILKKTGIYVTVSESVTRMDAKSDVAFGAIIRLILEWTELMKKAINESYQMGIGVATGGDSLGRLLP